MANKVIALIDHQNFKKIAEQLKWETGIDKIYKSMMETLAQFGDTVDIRSIVPCFQNNPDEWETINELMIKYNLSVELGSVLRNKEGDFKDTVDFYALEWAMTYYPIAETFILFTGDGDFSVSAGFLRAKKRKEVIVYTLDFSKTSDALFKVAPVRQLEIGEQKLKFSATNPFLKPLKKAIEGASMNEEDKEKLKMLAKAERVLHDSFGSEIPSFSCLNKNLQNQLNVVPKISQSILEIMIGMEEIELHQQLVTTTIIKPSTKFQSLESVLPHL